MLINVIDEKNLLTLKKDLSFSKRFAYAVVRNSLKFLALFLAYHVFSLNLNEYILPLLKNPNSTLTPYVFWVIILLVGLTKAYITCSYDKDIMLTFARMYFAAKKITHLDFAYDKSVGESKMFPVEALDPDRFCQWIWQNENVLSLKLHIWLLSVKIVMILGAMFSLQITYYACRYFGWL